MLEPGDFMDPRHKAIFAAVLRVFERYEAIDQITIAAELSAQGRLQEAGGQAYLNQLVYELPATVGAEHYARLVQTGVDVPGHDPRGRRDRRAGLSR